MESISFTLAPTVAVEQRSALEQLFFFNANQHRVLPGIQASIASFGLPEIVESNGGLRIRVGDRKDVENIFAVSAHGTPLGVAVFVHVPRRHLVVLHLVVGPRLRSTLDVDTPVLLELVREIRSRARREREVDRVELVYNGHRPARLLNA
jgi:hypothetical protein